MQLKGAFTQFGNWSILCIIACYYNKKGIYDANRYPVDDCLHCRSCQERDAKCNYVKITIVIVIATVFSILAGYFGFEYGSEWYIDVSIAFLFFVFLFSTAIAPVSSLWQTMEWVIVKMFEKTIWSLFAMAQASVFSTWSKQMSTGDPSLDAWLYIAVIPIIMNTFMFFMFRYFSLRFCVYSYIIILFECKDTYFVLYIQSNK